MYLSEKGGRLVHGNSFPTHRNYNKIILEQKEIWYKYINKMKYIEECIETIKTLMLRKVMFFIQTLVDVKICLLHRMCTYVIFKAYQVNTPRNAFILSVMYF